MHELDPLMLAAAGAGPGSDTRLWVSVATVDADSPQSRSVLFEDEDGSPLPYPMVLVTLQPSGVSVACRVGASGAGKGEGDWDPFVAGDEVLVVVPMGSEREGPTIIARYNQGRDTFPTSVGGMDVTKNTVWFRRRMAPMVLESGTALLLRNAATTAFLSIDSKGGVTATDGEGDYLVISSDLIALQTADTECMVQIDPSKQQVYLQAGAGGGTTLLLDSQGASLLMTGGNFTMITAGGGYVPGHAVTFEQVVNLLNTFLLAAAAAATAPPALVAFFASFSSPAILGGLLATAATGTIAPLASFITAALEATVPDVTGNLPGVARPALQY